MGAPDGKKERIIKVENFAEGENRCGVRPRRGRRRFAEHSEKIYKKRTNKKKKKPLDRPWCFGPLKKGNSRERLSAKRGTKKIDIESKGSQKVVWLEPPHLEKTGPGKKTGIKNVRYISKRVESI